MDFIGILFGSFVGILVFVLFVLVYFLPTIIAFTRRHPDALLIFLLNLFLGGTIVGWVIALIWSLRQH